LGEVDYADDEIQRVVIPYKPREPQLKIHEAMNNHRFVVGVAHRRMGKTVAALNQLIKSSLENEQQAPRYAYIAPTYSQAKRVAWDYLTHFVRPLNATANIAELRVDFLDRRIQLYGSDNPDSLRGQYFDGVVLDEIGDQNPKIWNEIIRPALADRKGWCLFIGTPKGNNHFKELFDRASKEPGWSALQFKVSETKIIDEQELLDARKEMGDDKYNQEFECSFNAAVEGSYYGKLINDLEEKGRMCEITRDDLCQTYVAWDLGMGDSTALWVAQNAGQETRLLDYVENHGQGLDWYVNWLKENDWHKAEQLLPHDVEVRELGTGKSRLEVLREAGLNVKVLPRLSVDDGIQSVRRLLPRCWFNMPKVKQGLDCVRNYRREYDEKRNVFYDKPLHDWASHGSDAFRYLALGMEQTNTWAQPLKINAKWIV
jgi:phage terminase large subunit